MRFSGPSLTPADEQRLQTQIDCIRHLMADGEWRSVREISELVERRYGVRCPENSAQAQCRNLRKPEHGGHEVICQGHAYRMVPEVQALKQQEMF